ncbi:MAG: aldehyde ferredoxin oxidoreductase family protein [Thaumarchaeota archaeon]|jgi:aldehyde:ferredoxin oxidoreductase|nr:aldehyde ferredoxin oxidoreductase family protein [Candidatus Geocrenenecus arthurdayi]
MSTSKLYGYAGKILWVNLTTKSCKVIDTPIDLVKNFVGARGFGAKILWDNVKPGIDPLTPENLLIFSIGPLAGIGAHSASRFFVIFKSPLTYTYFRSVSGGNFGAEMKFAGYDAIVVEGRAEKPTYLWIYDDIVEFRDASHVWSSITTHASEILLKETDRDAKLVVIGPAGERLVKFASIQTGETRSAGRGGGGAVMGSKNLKAIVVRGSKKPELFDEEEFEKLVEQQLDLYHKNPSFHAFRSLGTDGSVYLFYTLGHFPTYNFKQVELENVDMFRPEILARYVVKTDSCYNCAMECWHYFKTSKGPFTGIIWDKPEYETMWSFGGNLGASNLEAIMYANMLCDLYGLDTISAGSVIAFVYELYEKGILTKSELDGVEPRWGDLEPALELIRKIALREGVGNILAEGVKRAAEVIGRGSERFSIHVKGLELPAYDPRSGKAHGLNLATANIGASHMYGWVYYEFPGSPGNVDPFAVEGKGAICRKVQDEFATYEALGFCLFPRSMIPLDLASKMLYAATGIEEFKNIQYLLLVGERIINLERAFNVREGFSRKDDTLPERFLREPVPRPPSKGQIFELDKLLDDYYTAREWDIKTGIPTRKKLEELGLKDVADELEKLGMLPR